MPQSTKQLAGTLVSLSHDLREPLHSILGFARLMAEDKTGPLNDLQRRGVQATLNAGHRLQMLMDNLHDLAAPEADTLELTRRPIELLDTLSDYGSTFKWSPIAFSAQVPLTLPLVLASPTHLRRLIYNLAVVISECSQESVVWVEAQRSRPLVQIIVRGSGNTGVLEVKRLSAGARLGLEVAHTLTQQHMSVLVSQPGPLFMFELTEAKASRRKRNV